MKNIYCIICDKKTECSVLYRNNLLVNNNELVSSSFSVFSDNSHGRIIKCKDCSMVYVNPMENENIIRETYKILGPEEYLQEKFNREKTFERDIIFLEKFVEISKLLDVGCSVGLFLKVSKNRGWKVKGVEPSKRNSRFARDELGLDVINGDIHCVNSKEFDLITMWDVIEHLINPNEVIQKVNSLLKKGGIFALTTPNIKSLIARIMGEKWHSINRDHLFYFNKNTLRLLLVRHGFKIIYQGTYSRVFTIRYLINKIKNNHKMIYFALNNILVRFLRLGDMNIKINLFDELFIIAQKI